MNENWHWNIYGKQADDDSVVLLFSFPEGDDPSGTEKIAREQAEKEKQDGTKDVRVERSKYS